MYLDYYGLKERPFALVPDPRFLFLSRAHREALAHLLYGIESGDGFIEVVGQVGTGKTTLCRTLLGRVGTDVEIAYIFNPSPSEIELLMSINREFGLPTAARGRGELLEQLNRFLLEKRLQDRRVLLVIDEAQNLEPAVLEQIRLLSNLETDQEKLLQIILIGQPELEENLARADLRQLKQRITVRWDLSPFDRQEVAEYVHHRLRVAGLDDPDIFTPAALRALYRVTRGTPRVINAVADRALLAGYAQGSPVVTPRMVRGASKELPASEGIGNTRLGMSTGVASSFLAFGVVAGLLATLIWPAKFQAMMSDTPAVSAAGPGRSAGFGTELGMLSAGPVDGDLAHYLAPMSTNASAARALDAVLQTWGYDAVGMPAVNPNRIGSIARRVGPMRVLVTRTRYEQMAALNLPGLLELEIEPGVPRYAALTGISAEGEPILGVGEHQFRMSKRDLGRYWNGRVFYLWSNFESLPALASGMQGSAVRWLQVRLAELGYLEPGDPSGDFDDLTADAVRSFQLDRGLEESGQLGPATLIALYQTLPNYEAPRLRASMELS